MLANDQLIEDLAAAVLDGRPVDWHAAESNADHTARPMVQHLRLIAQVARVHHDLVPAADDARAAADDEAVPRTWGHLQLLERIGRGAFGQVFRAWDTRLDREVALKLLPAPASAADAEGSILREGRLLARVRHPNVVTIYGAEQIGDQIGLWMEFVRGRTLEQVLREGQAFRPAEIVDIGLELCSAVSAVHAAGLLHRDIKAHNVVRADSGRVVLMDFGTGRDLDDHTESDLAGTPLYLAPEVLRGGAATVRSDVYSVGVLLFRLATAAYPVEGRTLHAIRNDHEQGNQVSLRSIRPDVRPAMARVIERAIDAEPERRYEGADALARDLSALRPAPTSLLLRYAVAAAAVLLVALFSREAYDRWTGPLQPPRIVVRPFENEGETSKDALVDQVTMGFVDQLDDVEGLTVVPALTSLRLKDEPLGTADLGTKLNVNHVLEGSARFGDGTLIIKASLVSIEPFGQVWSDWIEEPVASQSDLVVTIEELTRKLVDKLRLRLGQTQRRYDVPIDVLTKYSTALRLRDKRGAQAREAMVLLEEVVNEEPGYAPALGALAATYGYLALAHPTVDEYTIPPGVALEKMEPLIERALKIDLALAEAHVARGMSYALDLRFRDAEASFAEAIRLEPNNSTWLGDYVLSTLLPWGKTDQALSLLEERLARERWSLDLRRILIRTQLKARDYANAVTNCRIVLERDQTLPFARNFCTWALYFNGNRAEALKQFEQWATGPPLRPGVRGYIHAIRGEDAEAEAVAAEFVGRPMRQAEIYGLMRNPDRVFKALDELAAINPLRALDALSQPQLRLQGHPGVQAFRRKWGIDPP